MKQDNNNVISEQVISAIVKNVFSQVHIKNVKDQLFMVHTFHTDQELVSSCCFKVAC